MAIAIFASLEGESMEDFSIRLAEKWRIGQRGLDNGVILLVFLRDRQLRLEIGYGLEARIPDAVAAQIIRDEIAPRFREQRYREGLDAAIDAVYERIEPPGAWTRVGRSLGSLRHLPLQEVLLWVFVPLIVVMGLIRFIIGTVNRVRELFGYPPVGLWIVPYLGESSYSFGDSSSSSGSSSSGGSSSGDGGGGFSGGGGSFGGGGGSFGGGGASGSW
jgi:uncharacterized protein